MAATRAQTLLLRIDSDSSRLRGELAKAEQATVAVGEKMRAALNRVDGGFGKLTAAAGIFRGVVGAIAAGALAAMVGRTFEMADALQDASERAGVGVESLQALGFAAQQTGSSQESLNAGMAMFGRHLGEAAAGSGELLPVLQQYGIGLRFVDGAARSTDDVLRDLADTIKNAHSEQEKLRIVTTAFGRAGAELLPMLRDGAAGLDAMTARARDMGLVLDAQVVKQAAAAKDKIDALSQSFGRLADALILKATPVLKGFADGLSRIVSPTAAEQVEDLTRKIELLREQLELPQSPRARARLEKDLLQSRAALSDLTEEKLRGGVTLGTGRAVAAPLPPLTDAMLRESAAAVTYRAAQDKKMAEGMRESQRVLESFADSARKVFEETRTPLEKFNERLEELNRHLEKGRIDWDTYGRAVTLAREEFDRTDKVMIAQKKTTEALAGAFDNFFTRTISSAGDWRQVLLGFAADVQRALFMAATGGQTPGGMIAGALIGAFSGGGDPYLRGIPGVGPSGMGFSYFGGPRAEGGPVAAGRPYMVGEAGPELFVPKRSGTIVPHHTLAQAAPSPSIVVNQTFQPGVSRAELAAILPQVRNQTIAAIQDARRRDPKFF